MNVEAVCSLKQRAIKFNQDNPSKRISAYRLRKLYFDKKVRFKKVLQKTRVRRAETDSKRRNDNRVLKTLKFEFEQALINGYDIVMIDEATFSQRSCRPLAWSNAGQNIKFTTWWKAEACVAACMAVSAKKGIIHFSLTQKSFTADKFITFLSELEELLSWLHPLIENARADQQRFVVQLLGKGRHDGMRDRPQEVTVRFSLADLPVRQVAAQLLGLVEYRHHAFGRKFRVVWALAYNVHALLDVQFVLGQDLLQEEHGCVLKLRQDEVACKRSD